LFPGAALLFSGYCNTILTYDTAFFSVADLYLFVTNLDLDSAFQVIKDPDPDPAVQVIIYPDPTFQVNSDPDPKRIRSYFDFFSFSSHDFLFYSKKLNPQ